MTMPLYIDKFQYAKILRNGGVEPELADLYAEALAAGLYQEVVQQTDLALAEAKISAYNDARMYRIVRPIYWMLAAMLVMHTFTLAKLFL
jgi:type VI protein secretion system component VasK